MVSLITLNSFVISCSTTNFVLVLTNFFVLPFFQLILLLLLPYSAMSMMDHAIPECAKPGFDMGMKSGGALGGFGAAAYTGLMTTCPSLIPHITAATAAASTAAGAAATMPAAAAAGTVAMPGLMMAGPMAPVAAMVAAGMLGGAMVGGAAGSLISCREVGVQNSSHYMIEYKPVEHPDGFMLDLAKDGRYRPLPAYNHHVHPRPHTIFDYEEDIGNDLMMMEPDPYDLTYDRYRFYRRRRRQRQKRPHYPLYGYRYPQRRPRYHRQPVLGNFSPQLPQLPQLPPSPLYYPKVKLNKTMAGDDSTGDSFDGFVPINNPAIQPPTAEEGENTTNTYGNSLDEMLNHMYEREILMALMRQPYYKGMRNPYFLPPPVEQLRPHTRDVMSMGIPPRQLEPPPLPPPPPPSLLAALPPLTEMTANLDLRRRRGRGLLASVTPFRPSRPLTASGGNWGNIPTFLAGTEESDGGRAAANRWAGPRLSHIGGRRKFDHGLEDAGWKKRNLLIDIAKRRLDLLSTAAPRKTFQHLPPPQTLFRWPRKGRKLDSISIANRRSGEEKEQRSDKAFRPSLKDPVHVSKSQ